MRKLLLSLCLLAAPLVAHGQKVTLPAEVKGTVGEWVVVPFEADGGAPKWRASAGLTEINLAAILSPKCAAEAKARVFKASAPGVYTLESWNAKGDVASDIATCRVVITAYTTPPTQPPPTDPPKPPIDPPTTPTGVYYFVCVRPDGPAPPSFTAIMQFTAWNTLRSKGYRVVDFTVTEARKYINISDITAPVVVVLLDEGTKSTVIRQPAPLPTTEQGVLALGDGLK